MQYFSKSIFAVIIIVSAAQFSAGQTKKRTVKKPAAKSAPTKTAKPNPEEIKKNTPPVEPQGKVNKRAPTADSKKPEAAYIPIYFYEFSQPNFLVSKILIEHDESGKGKISFMKRGFEQIITDPVTISPASLERLKQAFAALNFLGSTEDYQYEKDYSHLGNISIRVSKDGKERTSKFNWTQNENAKALADEYRKIGNQFVWIFDITVSRENQPLEAPRLIDALASMIKRREISDPQQMLPLLRELSNDERIPLIARNHAGKLVQQIEKQTGL